MNNIDWSKEQRQAPIGLILFAATTLRKLIKGVWPLLLVYVFKDKAEENNQYYFYFILASAAFLLINSLLSYWYSRFSIVDNEFVFKTGYLKKVKLAVDINRIQSVNISQNILQKLLGVVSVEIDTEGAKDAEIKLIAIKKQYASEFEAKFARKDNIDVEDNSEEAIIEENQFENSTKDSQSLVKLSFSDLLKVGITENHLKNLLIVVGLVYGAYSQIGEDLQKVVDEYASQSVENVENFSAIAFVNMAITIFIFSVFISIIFNVLGFFNLKMKKENNHFIITFGLIKDKKVNIPVNKIQLISWEYNPFKKLLGFKALKVKQASSGTKVKKKQRIAVPACSQKQQLQIENLIFNSSAEFSEKFKTNPFYFIKSFLIMTVVLSIPFGLFLYFVPEEGIRVPIAVFALFESVIAFLLFIEYKKRAYRVSDYLIEITKGQIATSVSLLQTYKAQSVSYDQSIFMKRRKLATLIIYTADGSRLTIPYIYERLATDLYNYLLFKVENSNKAWM